MGRIGPSPSEMSRSTEHSCSTLVLMSPQGGGKEGEGGKEEGRGRERGNDGGRERQRDERQSRTKAQLPPHDENIPHHKFPLKIMNYIHFLLTSVSKLLSVHLYVFLLVPVQFNYKQRRKKDDHTPMEI